MNPLPGLDVQWLESAEPLSTFLRYEIYRRTLGAPVWTRIADITDRALLAYFDARVAPDTTYEYDVIPVVDLGGEELAGDFGTPVQAELSIRSLFIHDAASPDLYVELHPDDVREATSPDVRFVQVWDRTAPTAHVGPARPRTFRASAPLAWEDKREVETALRALLARQASGATLVARWYKSGEVLFCAIKATEQGGAPGITTWSLELGEVYFREEVS